jgi:hypothetical protein
VDEEKKKRRKKGEEEKRKKKRKTISRQRLKDSGTVEEILIVRGIQRSGTVVCEIVYSEGRQRGKKNRLPRKIISKFFKGVK